MNLSDRNSIIEDAIKRNLKEYDDLNVLSDLVNRIIENKNFEKYVKELKINAYSSKQDIEQSILDALSNGTLT